MAGTGRIPAIVKRIDWGIDWGISGIDWGTDWGISGIDWGTDWGISRTDWGTDWGISRADVFILAFFSVREFVVESIKRNGYNDRSADKTSSANQRLFFPVRVQSDEIQRMKIYKATGRTNRASCLFYLALRR